MLNNFDDVWLQVLGEWGYFETEPDRAISEMTDNLVPVYTNAIIHDWMNLGGNDSDQWQEVYAVADLPRDTTITGLMSLDLWIYYNALVTRAYNEIKQEKEEGANE